MNIDDLQIYIPHDRLFDQHPAPTQVTRGSALFVDISGFTALTERLRLVFGSHQGAEQLSTAINNLYDKIIAEIRRYRGVVISFSGDAVTCWFDGPVESTSQWAMGAAFAVQHVIQSQQAIEIVANESVEISVKTAVASGEITRMIVGDPEIQYIDTVVGATITRMAAAEQFASRGDTIVDAETLSHLGGLVVIKQEFIDDGGTRFTQVESSQAIAAPAAIPQQAFTMSENQLHTWLLNPVYDNIKAGYGDFLTELRPAIALFLRFDGIDYEHDSAAHSKLDAFIQAIQRIALQYEAWLLQLTIGDKGSYVYISFGSLRMHEDDTYRAIQAALQLQKLPDDFADITVQIGISRGIMRTGAYGGQQRRVYGALGDEVNMAARLMQAAAIGDIVISQAVYERVRHQVDCNPLPPAAFKGKSGLIQTYQVIRAKTHASQLASATQLVHRDDELERLQNFIEPVLRGQFAGVIRVSGEAGIGKSRLIETGEQRVTENRFIRWLSMTGNELHTQPFATIRRLLLRYFQLDDDSTLQAQMDDAMLALFDELALNQNVSSGLQTELERAQIYLYDVLGVPFNRDNVVLTVEKDPQLRAENIIAAITTLFLIESQRQPLVLYVDDVQWLDESTRACILTLAQLANGYPLAIVLATRPVASEEALTFAETVHVQEITLAPLPLNAVTLITVDLVAQPMSEDTIVFIHEKTGGIPFYIEQLVLFAQENELLVAHAGQLRIDAENIRQVPERITSLLIARIDRLSAQVKHAVQTAAVLGQEFEVGLLSYMLRRDDIAGLADEAVKAAVWEHLAQLRYLFRHALLRDAAYEMQVSTRLRDLHQLAAEAIQSTFQNNLAPYVDDLAYHYRYAQNTTQEIVYSEQAAEQAAAVFANQKALDYYHRILELTPEDDFSVRYRILTKRLSILHLIGQDVESLAEIEQLEAIVNELATPESRASALWYRLQYLNAIGARDTAMPLVEKYLSQPITGEWGVKLYFIFSTLHYEMGELTLSEEYARLALKEAQSLGDPNLEVQAYNRLIAPLTQDLTRLDEARELVEVEIERAHETKNNLLVARALHQKAVILNTQAATTEGLAIYQEVVQLCRQIGYKHGQIVALNNIVDFYRNTGQYETALTLNQQVLQLVYETNDRTSEGSALLKQAEIHFAMGDVATARTYNEQAVAIFDATRSQMWLIDSLNHLSFIYVRLDLRDEAAVALKRALSVSEQLQDEWGEAMTRINLIAIQFETNTIEQNIQTLQSTMQLAR